MFLKPECGKTRILAGKKGIIALMGPQRVPWVMSLFLYGHIRDITHALLRAMTGLMPFDLAFRPNTGWRGISGQLVGHHEGQRRPNGPWRHITEALWDPQSTKNISRGSRMWLPWLWDGFTFTSPVQESPGNKTQDFPIDLSPWLSHFSLYFSTAQVSYGIKLICEEFPQRSFRFVSFCFWHFLSFFGRPYVINMLFLTISYLVSMDSFRTCFSFLTPLL